MVEWFCFCFVRCVPSMCTVWAPSPWCSIRGLSPRWRRRRSPSLPRLGITLGVGPGLTCHARCMHLSCERPSFFVLYFIALIFFYSMCAVLISVLCTYSSTVLYPVCVVTSLGRRCGGSLIVHQTSEAEVPGSNSASPTKNLHLRPIFFLVLFPVIFAPSCTAMVFLSC